MRRYIFRLANEIQRLECIPFGLRRKMLQWVGVDLSDKTALFYGIDFVEGPLRIADDVMINRGVLIEAPGGITIAQGVSIGFGAKIFNSSHLIGPSHRRAGECTVHPVSIGPGCWIGAGAIILPGVSLSAGTVVAAGAVVVSDSEPDQLIGGVPARPIRALS